uniref:Nucleolar protein 16 n=1 Tax=Timema bartmani TaxID=61472 RepID=A0A7R9I1H4_9NEOP|nr:unnamed protein product [Timema bartmani]
MGRSRFESRAPIKKEWENSKSAVRNIEEMGLVYDPNITFKIPKTRELIKPTAEEQDDDMIEEGAHPAPKKEHVAQSIEREARAPRERTFRLPSTQVQWLTYLMDKHGDNYKAMARDGKNYYQDTWKQIRAKINRFKGIPEQYNEYLEKKKNQDSRSPVVECVFRQSHQNNFDQFAQNISCWLTKACSSHSSI